MNPRPRIWSLAFSLVLMLAFLAGVSAPAQTGNISPAQYEEEQEVRGRGVLDIRLVSEDGREYPPGELVISNPEGEAEGYDPRSNQAYHEIPGGTYRVSYLRGARDQKEAVLVLRQALSGNYSLRVIGVEYGVYSLFLKGFDASGSHADVSFRALIQPGQVHHYLVDYSNRNGARLNVRRTRITE